MITSTLLEPEYLDKVKTCLAYLSERRLSAEYHECHLDGQVQLIKELITEDTADDSKLLPLIDRTHKKVQEYYRFRNSDYLWATSHTLSLCVLEIKKTMIQYPSLGYKRKHLLGYVKDTENLVQVDFFQGKAKVGDVYDGVFVVKNLGRTDSMLPVTILVEQIY